MNIINPYFALQENNIFEFRKQEFTNILENVKQMLIPAEELGFQIVELLLKDSRMASGELSKTIKQNLVIKLQKDNSLVDLSMFIPKIIDNNYIVINGRKKVPQFQLFDIPFVTRGETIKLRTNITTLMFFRDKEPPHIKVSFLGKKVPLALLTIAYFGRDEAYKLFDLQNPNPKINDLFDTFIQELFNYYEASETDTQDDFIKELGRYYTKYDIKSKGEDILYALKVIPQIDIFSAKFFTTPTVLEEIVKVLYLRYFDDTLFTNKRVRCLEYLLYMRLSKAIFELCLTHRSSNRVKFNVHSSQILSDCNVSDIVQFDFSINPIEELTKLSRISLLGNGGFNRDNVPRHLRDLCPSMFGRVCPVDTPDRDNCGVLQNLLPNVKLNENKQFSDEVVDKAPVSIPVSLVPFCEHDDQTRLQMASSQMRQAIMLKEFDIPLVQSGCEGLYTDQTQFVKRAKYNGEVIYKNNEYIIVIYENKEIDIFSIKHRQIYVENIDFFNVYVNIGDKFKQGDILAESNFCKNGGITIGRNLLTAVLPYYGNNYEDGIVISERLVKEEIFKAVRYVDLSFHVPANKILLSLDQDKYKPLPDIFERIQQNQPYALLKSMTANDFLSVFEEEIPLKVKKDTIITDINIFANEWNDDIDEYKHWVEKTLEQQKEREAGFRKILFEHLSKEDASRFIKEQNLDKFSFVEKYKNKQERINGMYIEMFGVYFRPIQVGDKIGNRHGNKGVISKIIPHEKMPKLDDGRHVDICINPLGIISRMNIGQLFELHLSMSIVDLKTQLLKMLQKNKSQEEIKNHLFEYIKIIDNTKDNWYFKQFEDQCPNIIDETFINELSIFQPPFESVGEEKIEQALAYTNTPFKQKLFDDFSKDYIVNDIAVGFCYFFRMVHIAETRLAARGIGSYARRTLQPLGGRKSKGGQRLGEMESACLIAHDAPINLYEFFTTKSDCIDLKNNYIKQLIEVDFLQDQHQADETSESVKLLNAYLTAIGVKK